MNIFCEVELVSHPSCADAPGESALCGGVSVSLGPAVVVAGGDFARLVPAQFLESSPGGG